MFYPERLVKLRKKKGLTQEELALKVNTTKGTISNYENEHSTPPHETLVLIADILLTTTDYLLGRTDNPSGITNDQAMNAVGKYNRLPHEKKKIIDDMIDALSNND